MNIPTFDDIKSAYDRIKPYVKKTPVFSSTFLNNTLNCELFFKCENFQKVGAFKFRGAMNALLSKKKNELERGVATHSSGNHAQALALAAKTLGVKATIVMPINSPQVKKNAVAGYGADIIYCEPTLESREHTLKNFIDQTGALFIHPYNNFDVICGQGTAAKELIEEVGILDVIIAPVGGGGLISGTSIATRSLLPKAKIFAAEPLEADDAARSFETKTLQLSLNPKTIADGLRTALSELTFQIILKNVDDILTVEEELIVRSMKLIWERMKIIIEPSSAVPLAAMLKFEDLFEGKKVGVILSGGNVDLDNLPW